MKTPIWLVLLVGIAFVCGCDWSGEAKRQRIEAENTRKWETAVSGLAKKHNAVSDCEAKLSTHKSWDAPLSIEVSRAFVQTNGQAILLVMELKDVYERNGSYVAVFHKDDFRGHTLQLDVELKCSEEQVNQLLHTEARGPFESYAVVAHLNAISRPRFAVLGTVEGGDEFGPVTGIELDSSPEVFCAKGECVELLQKSKIKE